MHANGPIRTEVTTRAGECRIFIELTININQAGVVQSVVASASEKPKEEETQWVIPEFKTTEKIRFGKKE